MRAGMMTHRLAGAAGLFFLYAVMSLPASLALAADSIGVETPARAEIKVSAVITGSYDGDRLSQPVGVAIDSLHREIYVANSGTGHVDVYSLDGRLKVRLPYLVPGADGKLAPGVPVAVAVDRRGRVFVVDQHDPMVDVLDFRGRSIKRLALPLGDGKSARPCAVAAARDGRVFVATGGDSGRVFAFSDSLELEGSWGIAGREAGQLSNITSIATTPDGGVAVVRMLDEPMIQLFSRNGQLLAAFGHLANGPGNFAYPAGVAVTLDDRVWVCDQIRHNVQVLDSSGNPLMTIGQGGGRAGELYYPCALATDGAGTLVISERGSARLQVWSVSWIDGPSERRLLQDHEESVP